MNGPRRTILVVDDEESMRYFLTKTLKRDGYHVIAAADGPEALAAAQGEPPDLALVDVRMPGMDGVAVLRALRSVLPDLPIVLMTGYGSVQSALHAMKQGATDYVSKPFRRDAIRATVAKALDRGGEFEAHTLRRVVGDADDAAPAGQPAPVPVADGVPEAANVERPARGVSAFLRERAEERSLPLERFPGGDLGLKEAVRLCELVYVDELLRLTGGNVSRAAETAGITRPNMHRKVIDLGLKADDYRRGGARGEKETR